MTNSTWHCCICGANVVSYNNPDPIRDSSGINCCNECNVLIREARIRVFRLPKEELQPYIHRLREMPYPQLREELSV